MVDILGHGQAAGAQPAAVHGMIGVTLDLDQLAVLDMGENTAPAMAAGAGGPGGCTNDQSDSPLRSQPNSDRIQGAGRIDRLLKRDVSPPECDGCAQDKHAKSYSRD